MGHIVRIQTSEQYSAALRILDVVPGAFHASGPSSSPTLVVGETQYDALVSAGVIPSDGKKVKTHGEKTAVKKAKS